MRVPVLLIHTPLPKESASRVENWATFSFDEPQPEPQGHDKNLRETSPTDLIPKSKLVQLAVLRFGLLVDGDVGIRVFPEDEEILILGASFVARRRIFGGIECIRASQA